MEKDLKISDITHTNSLDEIKRPKSFEEFWNELSIKRIDDEYMNLLAGSTDSKFRDSESYLRTEVNLVEVDFKSVLNQ